MLFGADIYATTPYAGVNISVPAAVSVTIIRKMKLSGSMSDDKYDGESE